MARHLEETGWAAELYDAQWRLVWVSSEILELAGVSDPAELGYGEHLLEHIRRGTFQSLISAESAASLLEVELPMVLHDTPGGKEELKRLAGGTLDDIVDRIEEKPPPTSWATQIQFIQGDLPALPVNVLVTRLHARDGEHIGRLVLYGPALPTSILSLVSRGDPEMFERMARLVEPGRRPAAILFADLQESGLVSKRLPSASYFGLLQGLITAIDEVIGRFGGVIGKHAGDGATAFFLAGDLGSRSAAVRNAIEAAREITVVTRDVVKRMGDDSEALDRDDVKVNVGVHWGGQLYMGQLITGGRLEVTALGDRVNEAARIQESACDGQVLASKSLLEHLSQEDARALGIDPDGVVYRTIAEMPSSSEKARRDAGSLPVTII
ncbi:MAG: adenylate/guanylate cyclase domain-containing protein [Actinomycetota bacterium]